MEIPPRDAGRPAIIRSATQPVDPIMNHARALALIEQLSFQVAKSTPHIPHEYTVRDKNDPMREWAYIELFHLIQADGGIDLAQSWWESAPALQYFRARAGALRPFGLSTNPRNQGGQEIDRLPDIASETAGGAQSPERH